MKGSKGIPALQLTTLNKLIEKFPKAPSLFFSNLFPTFQAESDTIEWEIEYGSAGMTPFVAPGAPAPLIGIDGVGKGSAKAAYYKEKMFFDEEFLNNMRQPGTHQAYAMGSRKLAKGAKKLDYRIQRRREWMLSQMILNGSLSYIQKGGIKFSVNYGQPESHLLALTGDDAWDQTTANPIKNIFEGKEVLADDAGIVPSYCVCNSSLLKDLLFNTGLQALLAKSAFGNGDLFANPEKVLGQILGCGNLYLYDELYEVPAWITSAITAGDTVINVDDASDFVAGGKLRLFDLTKINTWEDSVIASVDVEASTVTVAAVVNSYKINTCQVTMRRKFIGDDKFMMFNEKFEGEAIGEFMEAPYGVGRRWGKYADTDDEWDPEGVFMRVQDKGLPVLYHPDTTYTLTVK